MNAKYTAMIMGLFLFLGISVSMYGQDKYGSEPDKCKTNLSLFHEAVKMGNYDAAYEPWKWCLDNCPEASKIIYSDGIKMTEAFYDKSAGIMEVSKGQNVQTNDYIVKIDKDYFDTSKADKASLPKKASEVILVYTLREKNFPDNLKFFH